MHEQRYTAIRHTCCLKAILQLQLTYSQSENPLTSFLNIPVCFIWARTHGNVLHSCPSCPANLLSFSDAFLPGRGECGSAEEEQ